MATADVVVIGGGVNGASTAFNLARLGAGKVVLVERGQLGSGASGKSGALVRMHYTNPYESKLAFESRKIFQNWSDEVGGDCGWQQPGFVEVVAPGYEDDLAKNVSDQQEIGINTSIISNDDLQELFPEMYVEDIGAAAYEPESGWADPNATTYAFAQAAIALGAEIKTQCSVTSIVVQDGKVTGVQTTDGRIDTGTVVAAPGIGAGQLLDPLGLDLGLFPQRSKVALFRQPIGFRGHQPVVIDAINDAWMRADLGGLTLIGAESGSLRGDANDFDQTIDNAYIEVARNALSNRFPIYRDAIMRGGWAGLYSMSPITGRLSISPKQSTASTSWSATRAVPSRLPRRSGVASPSGSLTANPRRLICLHSPSPGSVARTPGWRIRTTAGAAGLSRASRLTGEFILDTTSFVPVPDSGARLVARRRVWRR
ncbi:MAG: FAD-dependent oxidoreductase [Thermomicrobiales bacterium]